MSLRMVTHEVLQLHAHLFQDLNLHDFIGPEMRGLFHTMSGRELRHHRSAQKCTCRDPHVMTVLNKNWNISVTGSACLPLWHYDAEMLQ